MNVDEATQAAKEYNENLVRQHFPLPSVTYSQRVAITLLAEVERLRAELAAAMAEIESVILLGPHPVEQVQMPLATFVETRFVPVWQYNELADKLERTQAELAAAKAESVCPVELVALGDADWECSVGVKCKSSEDADTLYNWLRDRMKERGEG